MQDTGPSDIWNLWVEIRPVTNTATVVNTATKYKLLQYLDTATNMEYELFVSLVVVGSLGSLVLTT